jgi:hypothetical protein
MSPALSLQVSYCLLASACASLVRFLCLCLSNSRSRIALPVHLDESNNPKPVSEDPFNVLKPVDAIDGESPPVAVETFRVSVRRSRIALTIFLAFLVACDTGALIKATAFTDPPLVQVIVTNSLQLFVAVYLLALVGYSIGDATSHRHIEITTHVAGISGLASLLFLGVIVWPTSSPPVSSNSALPNTKWLTWELTSFLLYTAVSTVSFTCPLKPLAFSSTENLYTEKEISKSTDPHLQEVCQSTSASLWGRIYFAYTDKVVAIGSDASSQVEVTNFPIVPVAKRATYLYTALRNVLQTSQTNQGHWGTRSTTSSQLLWKLIRFNGGPLLKLLVAGSLASISFYLPYLCLERFVSYLDSDPNRADRSWGWFYVVALFISGVLNAIVTGIAFSMLNLNLELPIRLQISTALYQKTLVRKDVVTTPVTSEDIPGTKAGKENENGISSRAQIMNLMTVDVLRSIAP